MATQLAQAHSSYLQSAKDQPVHWHPWGPQAFARARRESKPILLDIGAVWCHWCHVMDHESYEDPAIAEVLNRDWVCVKVDRDERPDVDARYQRAVQALTGQGGWPLTAFLTPDGRVFYGGTYFPPDGKYGRPGFATILKELARLYRDEPQKIEQQASELAKHLSAMVTAEARPGAVSPDVLDRAADAMSRVFDFRHGGFGSQPKFPHPGACDFLLTRWFDTGESWAKEIVDRTLTAMARGGIHDHLGGGFHRYSVDARWIVPHFEKMIYDNSELLRAYVHAGTAEEQAHGDATLYRAVVEGVVHWVTTVMSDSAGGYVASQDADVEPDDDGDYYTWTPEEVRQAVDEPEFEVLARYFDVDEAGEMRHNPKKNVLWIRQEPEQIAAATEQSADEVRRLLASGIEKLRRARHEREAPFVDRVLYVGWNGMMASAMLEAAAFLDRDELTEHALRTLDRLFDEAASASGGMRHAIGSDVEGLLDDQVHVAAATLDAYQATGERRWLDRGIALMTHVWEAYHASDGGLLDTPRDRSGEGFLQQALKPVQDSPTPSPNAVGALVFARLAEHTGDERWRERRDDILGAFAGLAADLSVHGATLLRAIDWAVMPPTHVVVVGDDEEVTRALHRAAFRTFRPRKVLTRIGPHDRPDTLPAPLRAMLDGAAPRAYVCAGTQCAEPVSAPEELTTLLAGFGR